MITPILRYCTRGNEVVRLQRMLRELDFALAPDGFLGPMTREALKTFQSTHGLPSTGEADPATWNMLEASYHSAVCMHAPDPAHTTHENSMDRRNHYESIHGAEQASG